MDRFKLIIVGMWGVAAGGNLFLSLDRIAQDEATGVTYFALFAGFVALGALIANIIWKDS